MISKTKLAITLTTLSILAVTQIHAAGLLQVHPTNPRYFQDTTTGKAVYLTGSHNWESSQDIDDQNPPVPFDFNGYLDWLVIHNHNFFRMWAWEQSEIGCKFPAHVYDPSPFKQLASGKFDLDQWNQTYFNRLRSRVIAAGNRNIYVAVLFFQGFSVGKKSSDAANPWEAHPFNITNNINGVEGDVDNDGQGHEIHDLERVPADVLAYQEAYVKKVVDTLYDLDNVIYEVGNEMHGGSTSFQNHIIQIARYREDNLGGVRHLHGMTYQSHGSKGEGGYSAGTNADLFNSTADWISPHCETGQDYRTDPPAADGSKVILSDTDHLWGVGGGRDWVWKTFTRGLHPIYMDPLSNEGLGATYGNQDDENAAEVRENLGATLYYASIVNLSKMTPQPTKTSTDFALVNPGQAYIVYQPDSGSFTVDLLPGTYNYEWFRPSNQTVAKTGQVTTAGGGESFTPPFDSDAVLILLKAGCFPRLLRSAERPRRFFDQKTIWNHPK